jgi:general L-amino acid transport system permease protein
VQQAYSIGVLNTIRVSVLGIVLATILGILIGIGRLSRNWIVAKLSTVYVETITGRACGPSNQSLARSM